MRCFRHRSTHPPDPAAAMQEIFLLCLGLGALVLIGQIALGVLGASHILPDALESIEAGAEDGLHLLSVRSVAAAATLFGAVGLWLTGGVGVPGLLALPLALGAGLAAGVATAFLTRQLLRFESSGTLRLDNAVGEAGTVYLPIPPRRGGFGKVQFTLQGRTVELRAVSDEALPLPTGSAVIIVAVVDGETVEVTPTPIIEGIDV
jgi:hypothetical protein